MKTNTSPYWRLEGYYFDGCNCKSICPCIFALDPTEGNCKGEMVWHIEKGHFSPNGSSGKEDNNNNNTINIHLSLLTFFVSRYKDILIWFYRGFEITLV
jgi:hypothetical protein